MQALIVLCIPLVLSSFFKWIQTLEEGSVQNERAVDRTNTN